MVLFLGKLEKCKRFCEKSKAPITEQELIIKVMYSLPTSMDSFCQSIRANPDSLNSYETIKSRLMTEYMVRGDWVQEAAPRQAAMNVQRDKKGKCHNCGKLGHYKIDCFAVGGGKEGKWTKQKLANKAEKNEKVKSVFMAELSKENMKSDSYASVVKKGTPMDSYLVNDKCSKSWIMDSGTTDHMCSNRFVMHDLKTAKSTVRIADSTTISAVAVGKISFGNITLQNVWLVPQLGRNLLSVAAIDKAGYKVLFENGQVKVLDKSKNELLTGQLDESGLYKMNMGETNLAKGESEATRSVKMRVISDASNMGADSSHDLETCGDSPKLPNGKTTTLHSRKEDINLWHKRMGHANFDAVRKSGINFNNKREFCEECQFGKSKILPFARKKE